LHQIRTEYIVHYFILKFREYFKSETKKDRGGGGEGGGEGKNIGSIDAATKKRIIKVKKHISQPKHES
jgi:hypothetical protein